MDVYSSDVQVLISTITYGIRTKLSAGLKLTKIRVNFNSKILWKRNAKNRMQKAQFTIKTEKDQIKF